MKSLKFSLLTVLTLFLAVSAFSQQRMGGRVVEVIDGKTAIVEMYNGGKLTVTLQYIEVPEPSQPLHQTVKEHLQKLISDKYVEVSPRGISNANTVGKVTLKGVDISQQMIRDGAAWYAVTEKSAQDSAESEIYQSNETQAQNEKRGIWSIVGLRPSWEIRAETQAARKRVDAARQLEEQKEKLVETENQKSSSNRTRLTQEERQQANAKVKIWADVSGMGILTSNPELLTMLESLPGATEPIGNYDALNQRGYLSTPLSALSVSYKSEKIKLIGYLMYLYEERDPTLMRSLYVIAFISESPIEKFSNAEVLTIMADNRKATSSESQRIVNQMPESVQEIVQFRMTAEELAKISNAKSLKISFGKYNGTIEGGFLKKIQSFLEKVKTLN